MKRITKIVLSLMTVLCIALYTMGVNAQGIKLDIGSDMSLTVSVGDGFGEMLSAVPEEDGTICYDLYRIADITEDGFAFQVVGKYSALEAELSKASMPSDDGRAPDWQELAQQALTLAVGGEGTMVNKPSAAD